jgi:hypothetical protein
MTTLDTPRPSDLIARGLNAILMRPLAASLQARPAEVTAFVRLAAKGADTRIRLARDPSLEGDPAVAASLYAQALGLLLAARRCEKGTRAPGDPLDVAQEWTVAESVAAPLQALSTSDKELLGRICTSMDGARFDRMDIGEATVACQRLADLCFDLRGQVEPRSPRTIRALGILRLVTLAIAIGFVAALAIKKIRAPKNIARGMSATASSRYPDTPAADGITNGDIEARFGVHTTKEANAWVQVDLASPRTIARAVIIHRGDGYTDEGLPHVLEASIDGKTFAPLARTTTGYSQSNPWVATFAPTQARYVRLRSDNTTGYVAIAELEVYER